MVSKVSQQGKGVREVFNFIKRNKLISQGLGMIPYPIGQAGSLVAKQLGLGKKRAVKRRAPAPSQVGGGIFSDLGGGIGSIAHGLFGGARKKSHRKSVIKM